MGIKEVIDALERNKKVFKQTLDGAPKDFVTWKQDPTDWCLLEIVCHLVDEEKEDFRVRVKHCLETPDAPLIPINPQAWPIQRDYIGQDFEDAQQRLWDERTKSVAWLRGLQEAPWGNIVAHPKFGGISAKSFFYNWLAHDYHHIRQINNLKYQYLKKTYGYSLQYAGNW